MVNLDDDVVEAMAVGFFIELTPLLIDDVVVGRIDGLDVVGCNGGGTE
jgi:hypothetical protein